MNLRYEFKINKYNIYIYISIKVIAKPATLVQIKNLHILKMIVAKKYIKTSI